MSAISLVLNMQPHPKERPRCFCRQGKARTYNSDVYTAWLNQAQISLQKQWQGEALNAVKKLSVQFYGNHSGKDLDNILGSVMDAMVHAGVLAKDNLSCINHIETAWERSPDGRIEILIELPETLQPRVRPETVSLAGRKVSIT
ncbi:MAG TPA: RusA family crossover junction endodeoxyribonuclease [Coleofasciculaceae cyanobacterium]